MRRLFSPIGFLLCRRRLASARQGFGADRGRQRWRVARMANVVAVLSLRLDNSCGSGGPSLSASDQTMSMAVGGALPRQSC